MAGLGKGEELIKTILNGQQDGRQSTKKVGKEVSLTGTVPVCNSSDLSKRPIFTCYRKMTPTGKVMTTVSSIFLPPSSSLVSSTVSHWRHSELLETTSLFLLQRYLGYAQIKDLFTEEATAYECTTPWNFIVDNQSVSVPYRITTNNTFSYVMLYRC